MCLPPVQGESTFLEARELRSLRTPLNLSSLNNFLQAAGWFETPAEMGKKAERDLAQVLLAQFEPDVAPLVLQHRENIF